MFWYWKSSVWTKHERKRINRRAFCPWRIGLRCHMRSTFEDRVFQTSRHFGSFLMKLTCLGHLLFRRSLLDPILELCRIRRKRLYVLQEINPRWLQMKKLFFMKNWGWDHKHRVQIRFLSYKSSFWRKYERTRINVRAFSALRIGLRCHMRSTFEETVSPQTKTVFRKFEVCGRWFWTSPKRFL